MLIIEGSFIEKNKQNITNQQNKTLRNINTGVSGKEPTCQCKRYKRSLHWKDPREEEMTTQSSILAWKISWIEESGKL